ncbi:hypothetical protein GGU10DRAFT_380511 [Lentinula aff. detonsa]|uniref:Uncharacterized protein n=1 Tax=Lentinula aff. detonsa TaxID=2804958 RepID=A0AA38KWL6_9AGAR|nr:hypothetical protein GGU10DRAFT_380511 [Lentinula aff. detonsa]
MPVTRSQMKPHTRADGPSQELSLSTKAQGIGPNGERVGPPRGIKSQKTTTKKVEAPIEESASQAPLIRKPEPADEQPHSPPSPKSTPLTVPHTIPAIHNQAHTPEPVIVQSTVRGHSPRPPVLSTAPTMHNQASSTPNEKMSLNYYSAVKLAPNFDWDEDDDGLTRAIVAGDIDAVHALTSSYIEKFPNDKDHILNSIRSRAENETYVLAILAEHSGDVLPHGQTIELMNYLEQVDIQGARGIFFHAVYLLRAVSSNFLPELCDWYVERFGEEQRLDDFLALCALHELPKDEQAKDNEQLFAKEQEEEEYIAVLSDLFSDDDEQLSAEKEQGQEEGITVDLFSKDSDVYYVPRHSRPLVNYSSSPSASHICSPSHSPHEIPSFLKLSHLERAPLPNSPPQRPRRRSSRKIAIPAYSDEDDQEDTAHVSSRLEATKQRRARVQSDNYEQPQIPVHSSREHEEESAHIASCPTVVNLGMSGVQLDGHEEPGDNDLSLVEEEDNEERGGHCGGSGPLPQAVKSKLDDLKARFDAEVEQIAFESGKSPQSCYKYASGNPHPTRAVTTWNIWQRWYGAQGAKQRPQGMPISEWVKIVRDELDIFLHSKLSDEEFDDPAAHEEALQEQIDWFWSRYDKFSEESTAKGKGDAMTRRVLRPIIQMSNRVYRESGFHIGGYIYHPDIGASVWVGTQALQDVKATNGTQMLTQARDIGTQIAVAEMVRRQVDTNLANLHGHCHGKKDTRARNRHVLPLIIAYDAKRLQNNDLDAPKVTATNFRDTAWRAQVRIVNWPVDVPFFRCGVHVKGRFLPGPERVTSFRSPDLVKICHPRIEQIDRQVRNEEAPEESLYFEMERWSEEEQNLPLKEQGKLPLVSDTNGKVILEVSHSESYHEALCDQEVQFSLYEDDDDTSPSRQAPRPAQALTPSKALQRPPPAPPTPSTQALLRRPPLPPAPSAQALLRRPPPPPPLAPSAQELLRRPPPPPPAPSAQVLQHCAPLPPPAPYAQTLQRRPPPPPLFQALPGHLPPFPGQPVGPHGNFSLVHLREESGDQEESGQRTPKRPRKQ